MKHRAVDFNKTIPLTDEIKTCSIRVIAEETMSRYSACAKIGFSPCQFRIGFWLTNTDRTLKEGIAVLRRAIRTTMSDTRYYGTLDGAIVAAAAEVVFKGKEVGLDYKVREEYSKLIQHLLSASLPKAEREKEIKND